ncbi:hypothetical protein AgCh_014867 [Apium graveolens]
MGSELWNEDELSWNVPDNDVEKTSDLDREWQSRRDRMDTGFNSCFSESVFIGYKWDFVTGARAVSADGLRPSLVYSIQIGQALEISIEWSNHHLFDPGGLEILDGSEPEKILIRPRVGIAYALPEHVNALWRFAIAGTFWISAPKNTFWPP